MINIKIVLSYDGTNYNGSQSQINGTTIADKLKKAVEQINQNPTNITFSSRTDAGVHAEGQIVNFFTHKLNMEEENWLKALNSLLPFDIRVLECEFVPLDFNARKNAFYRKYIYRLSFGKSLSALQNRYVAHYPYTLDPRLLQQYCYYLIGEHDFSSFSSSCDMSPSKIRYLHKIEIQQVDNQIDIIFIGNAFLHNMIRIIIGTLIELGRLKKEPIEMLRILESKDRNRAGKTFKACGLTLQKVYYTLEEIS